MLPEIYDLRQMLGSEMMDTEAGVADDCPTVKLARIEQGMFVFEVEGDLNGAESFEIALGSGAKFIARARAEMSATGHWMAHLPVDVRSQNLSAASVTLLSRKTERATRLAPDDLLRQVAIDSRAAAVAKVQRRGVRKMGFDALSTAAFQANLYAISSGDLEVRAFSLCAIGWRTIQRPGGMPDDTAVWLRSQAEDCLRALTSQPGLNDRWLPSIHTMLAQLALLSGEVERAVGLAEAVLEDTDRLARCPITAFNYALNLALHSFCRFHLDPKDPLPRAARLGEILKQIVQHMDIRFGTLVEFRVIYAALFLVARLYYVRRSERDARLEPVTIVEFAELVYRVPLKPRQVAAIGLALGIVPSDAA